jgi:hypothetical protein
VTTCAWCKCELAAGYIGDVCEACLADAEPVSAERAAELDQLGVELLISELHATREQLQRETVARLAAEERAQLAEHRHTAKSVVDDETLGIIAAHISFGAGAVVEVPGQVLTFPDRAILSALGWHALDDGIPSVAELAKWARVSESSVRRFLARMESLTDRNRREPSGLGG